MCVGIIFWHILSCEMPTDRPNERRTSDQTTNHPTNRPTCFQGDRCIQKSCAMCSTSLIGLLVNLHQYIILWNEWLMRCSAISSMASLLEYAWKNVHKLSRCTYSHIYSSIYETYKTYLKNVQALFEKELNRARLWKFYFWQVVKNRIVKYVTFVQSKKSSYSTGNGLVSMRTKLSFKLRI